MGKSVKPIEQWAEETPGVLEFLKAAKTHAQETLSISYDSAENDWQDFKRMLAISLRQLMENR